MIRLNRRPMESEYNKNYILNVFAAPISENSSILSDDSAQTTVYIFFVVFYIKIFLS